MSGLPWFKCFPQDLLNGMAGMPADERGIYISVLCLIYREGGPIRDDAREMAYNTGCTMRAWTKFRAALILHGKLFVVAVNGREHLMNERCQAELEAAKTRSGKNSESGSIGGKKTAENKHGKPNENNVTPLATAKRPLSEAAAILDIDTEVDRKNPITPSGVIAPKGASRPKASKRVPVEWLPRPGDMALAEGEGFSPGEIDREIAKFRDHEFRTPHLDWDATFRKWIRTAAERRPSHERPNHPPPKLVAKLDNMARAVRGAEILARSGTFD